MPDLGPDLNTPRVREDTEMPEGFIRRVRAHLRGGVRGLLRLVSVLSVGLAPAAWATDPALVFGVLNQQSPIRTAEKWNPILNYLTARTGIPLRLAMGPTVAATDAMMARGEFDLAFTNHNFQSPYDGIYQVVARWGGEPIRGLIVVPEDSPFRSLKDLQGRGVAFPSADAFVAYAVPVLALRDAGVSVMERFSGNQEGALARLHTGGAEAAAVNSRFLETYVQRERARFRTLYASEPYQELPVLLHPRVPSDRARRLVAALLGMRNDPAAAELLRQAHCPGFEPASERDYDNVRRVYRAIGK